ncbi:hypothetical protein SDC9_130876 [bioreactor metagenome]|uniref:Uncharacterized protein n=1 Tax=bioreactor metagenome TaxID=1076179 RepID=A0A645D3S6_9ZZZZ
MRRAKALAHSGAQGVHLVGVRHIHAPRQHGRALRPEFGLGGGQRIGLHVHQHQLHAQPRANARTLQAKAGGGPGQHRRLADEILNHLHSLRSFLGFLPVTLTSGGIQTAFIT